MDIDVAVLYTDRGGPYPKLPGVDAWDIDRDATTYAGPHPIIAHPPCGPWGSLRLFCGPGLLALEHLAPLAVRQLARWGGVLEHPRNSKLWIAERLPRPGGFPRKVHGRQMWAIEVNQCDWGHVARKPTWLLLCGVAPQELPPMPPPGTPTHVCSPGSQAGNEWRKAQGLKSCGATQRRRTPPAFAAWLAEVARTAGRAQQPVTAA